MGLMAKIYSFHKSFKKKDQKYMGQRVKAIDKKSIIKKEKPDSHWRQASCSNNCPGSLRHIFN